MPARAPLTLAARSDHTGRGKAPWRLSGGRTGSLPTCTQGVHVEFYIHVKV